MINHSDLPYFPISTWNQTGATFRDFGGYSANVPPYPIIDSYYSEIPSTWWCRPTKSDGDPEPRARKSIPPTGSTLHSTSPDENCSCQVLDTTGYVTATTKTNFSSATESMLSDGWLALSAMAVRPPRTRDCALIDWVLPATESHYEPTPTAPCGTTESGAAKPMG